ncbi:MAG: lysophospholipid acyltransferase family protein [Bacteroidota bacterium]|nr:lysophospholipid acyltransferase family protein [Bacteroidota bacterium]
MKNQIEYLLFRFFRFIILNLSLKNAQQLGLKLANIFFIILTRRKQIAADNLRQAFPEKSDKEILRIAKNAFQNFGITIVELLWFPRLTPEILDNLIKYKNLELMMNRYKEGKGVIMLSGHFGNWELLAFATGFISKISMIMIAKTQTNLLVDKIINEHRTLFGNKVVPMEVAVREVLSSLNKGGIVAMIADQSAPKESLFVNFFGKKVATFQGPAVFGLRTGAAMQMGIIIRKPDFTYEVIIEEIQTSDLTEYNEANVYELTQRHTAVLEKYIRLYPEQWMWTHRRWKNIK